MANLRKSIKVRESIYLKLISTRGETIEDKLNTLLIDHQNKGLSEPVYTKLLDTHMDRLATILESYNFEQQKMFRELMELTTKLSRLLAKVEEQDYNPHV